MYRSGSVRKMCLLLIAFAVLSACGSAESQSKSDDEKTVYVCPPCGLDCDEVEHDSPGGCGTCGMTLVVKGSQRNSQMAARTAERASKTVAILLFDGVQIIDYTGPWEVLGQAGFEIYTVAKSTETIRTVFGMNVNPDYDLASAPQADIIVVPGGGVIETQRDEAVRAWLNERAPQAEIILSVCNGAFILAKSGLLNGLKATTTRGLTAGLANAAPNIEVVTNTRFVDNGKVITAGGLSAGIDAALHVVARIHGKERAEHLARGIEYDWRPDGVVVGQ